MALVTVPYDIQIDHDGRKYQVHIPALTVPQCAECNLIVIDSEADQYIEIAFRQEAKLLTAEQIRDCRKNLHMTQEELAAYLGIAAATLSRWETGAQRQQRFHDGVLRAFFEMKSLREFLGTLHGIPGAADMQELPVATQASDGAAVATTA
jgi:putative zinc finger/helix-turn-helix YgiT family protein